MSSSDFSGVLLGTVIGGTISLVGVWLQGSNGQRIQQAADNAALAQTHWLRQRRLQEKAYFHMAGMVIDINSHFQQASKDAQDGGVPELLNFEGAQRDAASRALIEVQVYASLEVKRLWKEWLDLTAVIAGAVGSLMSALRNPTPGNINVATAWNDLELQKNELNKSSELLLAQMNSEMAQRPSTLLKIKPWPWSRRNA
jgi:hypothetical protein